MVDEEHTVQMVNFMLKAGGHQAIGLHGLRLAVGIEIIDLDRRRALDLRIIIRDRKTAFFIGAALVGGLHDRRIDENMRCFRLAFLGKVDNKHADRFTHLNGGKANARRIIHGVEHIAGEFAQLIVEAFNRLGNLTQHGIGKDDKRFYRHGLFRNGSRENRQLHIVKCSCFDLIKATRIS
ncbi:Aminotransferase, class I and II [Brucella canis ATCC 23365]|uniref:Aminotransferase, class I and II n=1 Tax=Brucella canis (strain ATCC 23365 / NCTC 10854 / RM-666) TaxID=483179 RepID=A9MCW1_BRUC2|nr:Aminotransferase, class I and II [Brucella canis ATCC 23365]